MKDWRNEAQAAKFFMDRLWEHSAPIPIYYFTKDNEANNILMKFDNKKDRDAALLVLTKI